MPRSGALDRLFTIEYFVETGKSATNQPVGSWQTFGTAWGKLSTLWGSESARLAAQTSETSVAIVIRYRSDVTNTMRLAEGGKTYRIEWTDDSMRRNGALRIVATEMANPSI